METQPTSHRIGSTDGVTVVAHDHGGDGPPVVFCHATGFHGRYWDPVIAELADDFRCLALDLRGHGDSEFPPELDMVWRGMAEDVLAVIDHFGLTDIGAVGHSMGGCSILLAEVIAPGTFQRAWLCEPIVIPEDRGPFAANDNHMAAAAEKRREVFESYDAAFERYASRPPFDAVDPAALRAYVDHGFRPTDDGQVILKCRGHVEAAVFRNSQAGVDAHIGEIAFPALVMGSGDGQGPAAIAPKVADELPQGRFELAADLTHFAPLEDPIRIAASIRDFLS